MSFQVERVTAENETEVTDFLTNHDETAVFLLGNMYEHGRNLTEHVNSGNFTFIRDQGKIVCVFCLTRRGVLLAQSELDQPVFEPILRSCKEENCPIIGLIGEWKFAKSFWQHLKNHGVIQCDTFYSKEINYSLELDSWKETGSENARLLVPNDYIQWETLRLDYMAEQGLPPDLSEDEMFAQYIGKVENKMIWGFFVESHMVSTAELNARTDTLATVGGVYTKPECRRKGYAKGLMEKLVFDCKSIHSLDKLIIFTGEEENKEAQKLYDSLGCKQVGHMALFFGK